MVFYGGEAKGLKSLGEQRPVKLNSLKTTIAQQLKSAEKVSTFLGEGDEPQITRTLTSEERKGCPIQVFGVKRLPTRAPFSTPPTAASALTAPPSATG
jgi:hypothetical protein